MSAKEFDADQESRSGAGLVAVGAILREARERQELRLEVIATDLHLRPEIVQALEAGDEAKLPGIAFIRGYVRTYARRLGLDDTELTAKIPKVFELGTTPLKTVGVSRRHAAFPLGKLLAWLVALSAVVAFIVYGIPALERLLSSTSTPVEEDKGYLEIPQESSALPGNEEEAPAPEIEEIPTQRLLPEQQPLSQEIEPESPVTEDLPPVEEQAPETVASEVVVTAGGAVTEPQAPAGQGARIQLRFREDSWVEMEAGGRKLIAGLQRAGSERTLRAEPPIQLLLGNASGVDVIYKGAEVDTLPYRRGRVARIVLED